MCEFILYCLVAYLEIRLVVKFIIACLKDENIKAKKMFDQRNREAYEDWYEANRNFLCK